MDNKGLIFIPDISGFTRFVNEMEIDHSRLIIQELLETLINSNQLGLEISEIEGDAILFYKFGESPGLEKIYKQVEKMFCEFYKSLLTYDNRRFCYCPACNAAVDLSLKVITHYGEFTGYTVKNFSKLIGKDIIVAHQLLKNDIELHEYWLITSPLAGQTGPPATLTQWMKWDTQVKHTENGDISFYYAQLGELKNEISAEPVPPLQIAKKTKMFSVNREYNADIIRLFHACGDFNYRDRWLEGVKKVEEVNHILPRIGTRCRCLMENGESVIYTTSYSYSPEKIEFSETDENKKSTFYYTLEKINDHKTRLTIDYYREKNFVDEILFRLTKRKKAEDSFSRSLLNLDKLAKEID